MIVVAMTSFADRSQKPLKPIALVEGDSGGHFGYRLGIASLET